MIEVLLGVTVGMIIGTAIGFVVAWTIQKDRDLHIYRLKREIRESNRVMPLGKECVCISRRHKGKGRPLVKKILTFPEETEVKECSVGYKAEKRCKGKTPTIEISGKEWEKRMQSVVSRFMVSISKNLSEIKILAEEAEGEHKIELESLFDAIIDTKDEILRVWEKEDRTDDDIISVVKSVKLLEKIATAELEKCIGEKAESAEVEKTVEDYDNEFIILNAKSVLQYTVHILKNLFESEKDRLFDGTGKRSDAISSFSKFLDAVAAVWNLEGPREVRDYDKGLIDAVIESFNEAITELLAVGNFLDDRRKEIEDWAVKTNGIIRDWDDGGTEEELLGYKEATELLLEKTGKLTVGIALDIVVEGLSRAQCMLKKDKDTKEDENE